MRTRILKLGWITVGLVLFVAIGCEGPKGSAGTAGMPAVDKGSISGTVTESGTGNAIAGATVAVGSAQATTDSAGNFTIADLSVGVYKLTVSATGYNLATSEFIGIVGGQTASVNFSLSKIVAANQAPVVSLASQYQVGYGTTATLNAVASDPNGDPLTYTWTGATGSGSSATLTTSSLISKFGVLEDRFGLIGITPSAQASYSVKVTVSDGKGGSASATATVTAAETSAGIRAVPTGLAIYLNSGHSGGNTWTCTTPTGALCTTEFLDGNTQTPRFTPSAIGAYKFTEVGTPQPTGTTTIYAGTWVGVVGTAAEGACTVCHNDSIAPDNFTPWKTTAHSSMAQRGIDGQIIINGAPFYMASCLKCHTVGNDPAANNGGFDDLMASTGWLFPTVLKAGTFATMPAALQRLANIQCENCHGPQGGTGGLSSPYTPGHALTSSAIVPAIFESARVTFDVAMCAQCHDAPTHHMNVDQWRKSGHSNLAVALAEGTGSASCVRCHAGQGFVKWLPQVKGGNPGSLTPFNATIQQQVGLTSALVQPQTCQACHDPHDATNEHQLRVYGTTPTLPSGFSADGFGAGALCVMCHNSRNGVTPTSGFGVNCNTAGIYLHEDGDACGDSITGPASQFSAPHQANQGDVFLGRNAYFMGSAGTPHLSKHANVEEACVGCHMILNPDGAHVFTIDHEKKAQVCANCHGSTTGEGLEAQVEGLLDQLAEKIENRIVGLINASVATQTTYIRAWDPVTDCYSSSCTSSSRVAASNVAITTTTGAGLMEVHGQQGAAITLTTPVTVQFTGTTSSCWYSTTTSVVYFQLGAVKDGQDLGCPTVPAANFIVPRTDPAVKAGWNFYLIEAGSGHGVHNPTFAVDTLWNSIQALP